MSTNASPAAGMTSDQILALIETGKTTLNDDINHRRAEIVTNHRQFTKMGGDDKYDTGIEEVVNKAGKDGITAAELHVAFPDGTKVNQARDRLVEAGKITSAKSGMTSKFLAVTKAAEAAPSPQAAPIETETPAPAVA